MKRWDFNNFLPSFTGAKNHLVRKDMRKHPEAFFNRTLKQLGCSLREAYRLTVANYVDPYFTQFSFTVRGERFQTRGGGGPSVTAPSESEVGRKPFSLKKQL